MKSKPKCKIFWKNHIGGTVAYVTAECSVCGKTNAIESPTTDTHYRHKDGRRERIPDEVIQAHDAACANIKANRAAGGKFAVRFI
jgi:phage FluMu protein Com